MKHTFVQEDEFENHTGLASLMQSYADLQVQKDENPVFRIARQSQSDENIYTAIYDVINRSSDVLYSLTVKLDLRTNDYSSTKSHTL